MRAGAPEAAKGQARKRRARLQGSPGQALTILSQAAVSHPVPGQAKAFRLQKSKFRAPRPAPGREHGAADVRNMDMDKKTGPEPVQDSGETGSPQERDSRHSPRRVSVQYRPLGRHFLRGYGSPPECRARRGVRPHGHAGPWERSSESLSGRGLFSGRRRPGRCCPPVRGDGSCGRSLTPGRRLSA